MIVAAVPCLVFVLWARTNSDSVLGLCGAALCLFLFTALMVQLVSPLFRFYAQPDLTLADDALGPRSLRFSFRHPWVKIAVAVLLLRVALYVIAYAVSNHVQGYSGGIFETLRALWVRTDAPHYLGLAQNGYVTEGDPRFHIVFFPLYPLLVRGMWYIVRDWFAAAMVLNNILSVAGAIAFYELAALDFSRKDAFRALRYLLIFPAAFFFGAPMTESLFVLLSVMALYFARKRQFLPACVMGGLAALSRLPGVLLAAPIAMECLADIRTGYLEQPDWRKVWQKVIRYGLCLLIVPLGVGIYFYINYAVTGDAFTFLRYQREHWYQSLTWFFSPASYIPQYLANALAQGDLRTALGLYLPNLAAMFLSLLVMFFGVKRLRPSYTVYFLLCFVTLIGGTWLISAPRYLASAFPLALSMVFGTRNKTVDVLLSVFYGVLLVVFMGMFVVGYPIY